MSSTAEPPGWRGLLPLLSQALVVQSATFAVRPAMSYRGVELGLGSGSIGLIASAFAFMPFLFAFTAGRLCDSRGFAFVIRVGVLLMVGAVAGLALFASSVVVLLLFSGLMGLGHLCVTLGHQAAIATQFPSAALSVGFGYLTFVVSIGQMLGPLGLNLFSADGAAPDTTSLFVVAAIVLVLSSALGPGRRTLASMDAAAITGGALTVLRSRGVLPAFLVSGTVLATIDLITAYLPALGSERGWGLGFVSALLAIRGAASAVSRLLIRALEARMGARAVLMASVVVAGGSLAVVVMIPASGVSVALMGIVGFALGLGQPITLTFVTRLTAPQLRGRAMSLRLMTNRMTQLLLPGAAALVAPSAGIALTAAGLSLASMCLVAAALPGGTPRS